MRFENAVFRAGRGLQRDTLSAFFYRTGKSITIPTPGTAGDVFVIDDLLFIADGPIQGLTVMRLSPRPGLLPDLDGYQPIPQVQHKLLQYSAAWC